MFATCLVPRVGLAPFDHRIGFLVLEAHVKPSRNDCQSYARLEYNIRHIWSHAIGMQLRLMNAKGILRQQILTETSARSSTRFSSPRVRASRVRI